MVYQCIECGAKWGEGEDDIKLISGSACITCLLGRLETIYHRRQLEEGNSDCFNRNPNCERHWCLYYPLCVNHILHVEV